MQQVPYIWYPVWFQETGQADKNKALIDSDNEVNAIIPVYIAKLGFIIRKVSVKAQNIDGMALETYGMVLASFLLQNSLGRVWFFEETFLLADTSMKVVLRMLFLSLNNVNVKIAELRKFT